MSDLLFFYNQVSFYENFPSRQARNDLIESAKDLLSRGVISSQELELIHLEEVGLEA